VAVGWADCQLRRILVSGVSRGCRGPLTLPRSLEDLPAAGVPAVVVVVVVVLEVLLRRRCNTRAAVVVVVVTGGRGVAALPPRPRLRIGVTVTVTSIDCVVGGRRCRGALNVGASVLVVDTATPPVGLANPSPWKATPPLPRCRVTVVVAGVVAVDSAVDASRAITIKCKVNDAICKNHEIGWVLLNRRKVPVIGGIH